MASRKCLRKNVPDETTIRIWWRYKQKNRLTKPFGTTFTKWWKGFQPSWRIQHDGTLCQDVPAGEHWLALKKGVPQGFIQWLWDFLGGFTPWAMTVTLRHGPSLMISLGFYLRCVAVLGPLSSTHGRMRCRMHRKEGGEYNAISCFNLTIELFFSHRHS